MQLLAKNSWLGPDTRLADLELCWGKCLRALKFEPVPLRRNIKPDFNAHFALLLTTLKNSSVPSIVRLTARSSPSRSYKTRASGSNAASSNSKDLLRANE